jgi:hypothetical protein
MFFQYYFVHLHYTHHPKKKRIRLGRSIRTDLANNFCIRCNFEWNQPVSIDTSLAVVEKELQCNIYIIDAEESTNPR